MKRLLNPLWAIVVGAAAAACHVSTAGTAVQDDLDTATGIGSAPVPVTGIGLPCNVRSLLETYCTDCHAGATPAGGVALTSYEDLVAKSPINPSQTVAQRARIRMADAASPMPPPSLIDARAKATFDAWVDSGAPATACGVAPPASSSTPDPTATAGAPGPSSMPVSDAGAPPATPPAPAPPVVSTCTSGSMVGRHERDRPGTRCIQCHSARGGPLFSAAGTLYPTLREPDGCIANTAGAIVEITDANGKVSTMPITPTGNFFTSTPLEAPYTVRVLKGGNVRKMVQAVFNGDCNGCHTEYGLQGAPGRVALP